MIDSTNKQLDLQINSVTDAEHERVSSSGSDHKHAKASYASSGSDHVHAKASHASSGSDHEHAKSSHASSDADDFMSEDGGTLHLRTDKAICSSCESAKHSAPDIQMSEAHGSKGASKHLRENNTSDLISPESFCDILKPQPFSDLLNSNDLSLGASFAPIQDNSGVISTKGTIPEALSAPDVYIPLTGSDFKSHIHQNHCQEDLPLNPALGLLFEDEDSVLQSPDKSSLSQLGKTCALQQIDEEAAAQGFTVVQVAVNRALYQTYDYKVKGKCDQSYIGRRVKISFGVRSTKLKEVAIITGIGASSIYSIKKIKEAQVLDDQPWIDEAVFKTLKFASSYYHYPIGQTLQLGLPKMMREGSPATYKEIPGFINMVKPGKLDEALGKLRSKGQKELLLALQSGPRKRRELREQGFSLQQENVLIRLGLAKKVDLAQDLPPFDLTGASACDEILANKPFELNDEQASVLKAINEKDGYGVFLLSGVTGSGKTEVYLQAIEHTLKQGKKAMVLVPEIALTPQTFKRFYARFKVPIATMHSTLSDRERMDAFLDMACNRAAILIGTRSALFSSIPDLGLIVIDEEHDSSFKQNDGLRYHARSLAVYRAHLSNCKVILGSATPSLESVFNTQIGRYRRLDLFNRARNSKVPDIVVVDLKTEELNDSVRSGIGSVLENAIGVTTAKHNQALLFLNRRGFSNALICHTCCKVITCPHCDNQLTVHRNIGSMRCHICDYSAPILKDCPYCGGKDTLLEIGIGTEQVESYLKERFPDVGIERIDRDVITSKEKLDQSLKRILNHESEIMIGTQMLAKGHDFPDVTTVGIIDVDSGLFCDDFRGLEYTAQLITQVAGRAGRADKRGIVYIQTRFPEHQLLTRLTTGDFKYIGLACELLDIRREMCLPPFTFQATVMTNSTDRNKAFDRLKGIFQIIGNNNPLLQKVSMSPILPDKIEKRFNRYHFHITITAFTRDDLSKLLDAITDAYSTFKNNGDLRFAIDVDPINNY